MDEARVSIDVFIVIVSAVFVVCVGLLAFYAIYDHWHDVKDWHDDPRLDPYDWQDDE